MDIESVKQEKITSPPNGFGDYAPQFLPSIDKPVWLRGTSITDSKRDLWIGNVDGSDAEEWIRDVEGIVFIEVIVLVAALRRPRFFDKEIIYRGWRLIYQDSRSYFAETAYKSGRGS